MAFQTASNKFCEACREYVSMTNNWTIKEARYCDNCHRRLLLKILDDDKTCPDCEGQRMLMPGVYCNTCNGLGIIE